MKASKFNEQVAFVIAIRMFEESIYKRPLTVEELRLSAAMFSMGINFGIGPDGAKRRRPVGKKLDALMDATKQ